MFNPAPSSHIPSGSNLYDSSNVNQLSHQMQDMTLAPPLPQSLGGGKPPNPQIMPGGPSPQHQPPLTTNVTYSSQPRATYPYINNNPPGSPHPSMQRPTGNLNQFNSNSIHSAQPPPPVSNAPGPKTNISSPMLPLNTARYSNGMSNGHDDKPNLNPELQSPRHLSNAQPNYNLPQSPPLTPQGPYQRPPQQMGPPGTGNPLQFPGSPASPMSQSPLGSMSNLRNQPMSSPQPGFQPYPGQGPPGAFPQSMPSPSSASFQPGQPQPGAFPQGMPPSASFQPGSPQGIPPSASFQPGSPQGIPPSASFQPGSPQGMPPSASFQPGSPQQYQGIAPLHPGSPGALPPGSPSQYGNMPSQQLPPGAQSWQGAQYPGGPASPPGSYPYGAPNQGPVQQQPRKMDLDYMPSNVLVREDDRKMKSGTFITDTKGQIPPMVTTDFTVQDRGICSPRFIRSSLYCLPTNPDVLKQTSLPFAITINPVANLNEGEEEPPTCLYRDQGPLRCKRCKAYICPFMTFMEGGRCFQCPFCKVVTEVPQDYFCFLDGMGERTDKYHRPELCLGSYEYIATKEYCRNDELPNPPAYIFMIEVSNATFRNGLIPLLCESMKQVLKLLQSDERNDNSKLRVGFVTYNNVLHFYNMKKNLSQPHIMVLSDVHNAFVPLLDGFLVTLDEAEALVDSLMEHIPRLFINELATEIILGPVIQVGLEALKNANCSGKLLVFHSTIPNADAPGKLPHREGQKLLGTDKQKIILAPQTDFYSKLAQDCVAAGCAVDLFLFPSAYVDIASLSPLCRHTGGQMFKYTFFQSHVDGTRFLQDLESSITTPTAFDAVLRVRTSAGISPVFYYGNFYMSNATDIELSAIDCHKSVTVEFAYDDKLPENETVFIQAALLYTTCTGERRIRVHNLALPTSVAMPDVFQGCELDTLINFFAKQALKQLLDHSPQQMRNSLMTRCVKILSCYRKNCSTSSSSVQLILPEALKLLPLYMNCLLKSDAVAGGSDMALDDRSFSMLSVNSMDVLSTATYFYPTLIPIHNVDPDSTAMPSPIRCAIEKLSDDGAYLLENGIYMFLWIGQSISPEWLQNVLSVQSTSLIDKASLPELNTALSKRIRQIIDELEYGRQWYMKLSIMVQGDKLEIVFRQFLVEDQGSGGSLSYVDFLRHLHKEISSNP